MMSINQVLGYTVMMENWKAINLRIPILEDVLVKKQSIGITLRSESSGQVRPRADEPYAIVSAKLWNRMSDRFRSTNLTKVAMIEAKNAAKDLPI